MDCCGFAKPCAHGESLKRITELGHLHDAKVRLLTIGFFDRVLRLGLDNFYANFQRSVNYPGAVPGSVVFTGISKLSLDLEPLVSLHEIPGIYELEVIAEERGVGFVIKLSPAGRITGNADALEITETVPGKFRQADS